MTRKFPLKPTFNKQVNDTIQKNRDSVSRTTTKYRKKATSPKMDMSKCKTSKDVCLAHPTSKTIDFY